MNKRLAYRVGIAGAGLMLMASAAAQARSTSFQKFEVRTSVAGFITSTSSGAFGLNLSNEPDLTVDATYYVTPNIGVNVLATFLNFEVNSKALGNKSLGSVDLLPPIFSLQYHFMPNGKIRPYVGVGFNYNFFSNESGDLSNRGTTALGATVKNKLGYAATVGADYMITPNLALNVSFNFLYIGTYVHLNATPGGGAADTRLHVRAYIPGAGIAYRF